MKKLHTQLEAATADTQKEWKKAMKVLIVNTSEKRGGAAVAARRLTKALKKAGVNAMMLVRDKTTQSASVMSLKQSRTNIIRFAWERICIMLHNGFDKKNLFAVSIANTGYDITQLPEFKEADIIHLHWINQGFISIGVLKKILKSGKPIVWTMHDMWPCTGICHHARECDKYSRMCRNCPFIKQGKTKRDLSYRIFKKKLHLYRNVEGPAFVTCSRWLKERAEQSLLLKGKTITDIPNPLDTKIFCKKNRKEIRQSLNLPQDKKLILFGSVKITDKRKGIDYLIEACNILAQKHPETKEKVGVMVMGNKSEYLEGRLPFEVFTIPYETEEQKIANIYNAADMFATPSLEENLPNMVMEAMACGLPCLGFNIGGIPEMIDHLHNGYVAEYRSAEDFAKGINYLLFEDSCCMSEAAIRKVHECYDENIVAQKYIEVYNSLMS